MYLGVRKDDHRRVAIKALDRKVTKPLPTSGAGSDVLNEVRERSLAMRQVPCRLEHVKMLP